MVVFLLMGVYAFTEDFPGQVKKPHGVCWFDFGQGWLFVEVAALWLPRVRRSDG